MSTALKNRLVGTIIIVALAVIFLPDILDGKKQTTEDLFVSLPTQPDAKPVDQVPAFPTEQIQQETERKVEIVPDVATDDFDIDDQVDVVNNETNSAVPAVEQPAQKEVQQASIDRAESVDREIQDKTSEQPTDTPAVADNTFNDSLLEEAGWVVQLGVFRHQKNVRELLSQLRDAGYRAFSRPVQTSSGELTKVFVGPDLEKESLEKALPHLRSLTKLQGRITPFTVK